MDILNDDVAVPATDAQSFPLQYAGGALANDAFVAADVKGTPCGIVVGTVDESAITAFVSNCQLASRTATFANGIGVLAAGPRGLSLGAHEVPFLVNDNRPRGVVCDPFYESVIVLIFPDSRRQRGKP